MALASEQAGIGLRRHFTTQGDDPFEDVLAQRALTVEGDITRPPVEVGEEGG